ncbi:hypothetical protein SAMN05518672_10328 [Chitinophaga sp. CF118]|uniref:hypothetical protein n=1 Tax=Chitinophaga sp. CF118 TaxID=1884367 RepID=UPI0008E8AF97|nr:hypothetical protein [Chitinophaga sp. CF118]SFD74282.1 hypothetical protein SAMN05518672_10328 [Chitinophaga sp. CF118]
MIGQEGKIKYQHFKYARMTFKRSTINSFLLGVLLSGCYSLKIPLSEEEENFGNVLAEKYHCEVNLEHNYKAIKENRRDGEFWIELKNSHADLCSKDRIALKNITSDIGKQFFPSLTHKLNYKYIEVVFYKSEHPDKQTEHTLCEKHLTVSIENFNNVQVTYWH